MTEWQPRWVAYAAAHGRTPEEQAAHDTAADGTPLGGRFMAWIDANHQTLAGTRADTP